MNRSDYVTIEKSNGIATIWLDKKDDKVNIISPILMEVFESTFKEIEEDDTIKAAVIISRKNDFIVGADIKSFKAEKKGDFRPISEKGHTMLSNLAASKKPVVAAINGTSYGLGLELPLACHARIASTARHTKIALPEVKLGLLPGAGGTQRLPRLVGLQKALDIMLTGKNVFPKQALKMGLVDEIVHPSKLHKAACKLALDLSNGKKIKRKVKKSWMNWFLDDTSAGRSIVFNQARKKVMGMTKGNYPAVPEIINCVEIGLKKGMKAGFEAEAEKFEALMIGQVSKELINIFFTMTEKKKNPQADLVQPYNNIAMLGAGFMGAGITEVSINNGVDVLLKDIRQETISEAKKTIWKSIEKKLKRKSISKIEAEALMAKVQGRLDYQDFDSVEIVIEAVFEDLGLKQRILAEVEANTHDKCIFASNTSALPISKIAAKAKRPELIIGMHYFSPVPKMPLLEIVKTPQTADWVVATCLDLGIKQGKTCIVVNDAPGFYTTRILAVYLNEAALMLEEGADISIMDKNMQKWGFPVGPITLMDEVGLDVGAHIMEGEIMEEASKREGAVISLAIKKMNDAGYKGRKGKKGFFLYDDKGKKVKGKVNEAAYSTIGAASRKEFDLENMQFRLGLMMVNEAVLCLEDNVIENPTDGDVGAVFGLGFPPFTGGPFRYIDYMGTDKIVAEMEKLRKVHGERFKPANLLVEHAKSGKKFHN